jgi:lipoprotein-anchoring transpeptidase ErfK/SrfK
LARWVQITLVFFVTLILLGAVGAYAWDSSKSDQIAEGVTIGGVDVGGMTEEEASNVVEADLIGPLDKPVTVTYEKEHFTLDASELDVQADVDGMVSQALAASQEGSLPTRVWRYASGGEVDEAIDPEVTYDEKTLDDFIKGVQENVNQPAVDASVEPTPTSLDPVEGQTGIEVKVDDLRAGLEQAVQSTHSRTVEATVEKVQPEVTTEELAEKYPDYLVVDRASFQLRHYTNLELTKTYTVAIGQAGYDTPVGLYSIASKQVNPAWSVPNSDWAGDLAGTVVPGGAPNNPLVARWMGIYDGAGIHGTNDTGSLGSAASHGCIRMAVPDVIELYDQVEVGTPIYIS